MTSADEGLGPWGPVVEELTRLQSDRGIEVVAERVNLPLHVIVDGLLSRASAHRYIVLERIAETRRSRVMMAVDLLICRAVAIKVHRNGDDETTRRALSEVRAMSKVDQHDNVVRVFDIGEHDGQLYTVMELCDADLATWSLGKSWSAILDRILEAGAGLVALHGASLVHADVKPANILVSSGIAKIADLGLCGPPGRVFRISGTPGFIAPEAADGLRVEAGDVFGLACSAWSCLLGVEPFGVAPVRADASSAVLVLVERARAGELEVPLELPTGLPLEVLDTLRAGLRSDPRQRPSLGVWLAALSEARSRRVRARLRRMCAGLGVRTRLQGSHE